MKLNLKFICMVLGLMVTLGLIYSCANKLGLIRSTYTDHNDMLHESDSDNKSFLKAHFRNGDVVIFEDSWKVDTLNRQVLGSAVRYNYNRELLAGQESAISIDSVALFETNDDLSSKENGLLAASAVIVGGNIGVATFCATNPKACFGSCPTFYTDQTDNVHQARAEGFSNAILPSFEYEDIDAIGSYQAGSDGKFQLTMKNEALETHCIKELNILAVACDADQRVLHDPRGQYYLCGPSIAPSFVDGLNESDFQAITSLDDSEYLSEADPDNLNTKEEIYLEFDEVKAGDLGLEIRFRQGFLTTYLIYSALGYMGNEVSDYLAQVESDPKANERLQNGIKKVLGNIEVFVWQQNEWKHQGGFNETGPIAKNHQLLRLKDIYATGGPLKVKVVLNKGLWKIDYLGITPIQKQAEPTTINPSYVALEGIGKPQKLAQLANPNAYLISMPGNAFQINYQLPKPNQKFALFLAAKGYYLEWMRKEWLAEESKWKLYQLVYHPEMYLRSEAAAYKIYEGDMESTFWNSRVETESLSLYE